MARFGRLLTAMVTPFDQSGALDLDGAQKLARWLVANGSDGLVVAGTTGESPTLTHAEHLDLIGAVREAVDVAVVAGTGSNDTAAALELTIGAASRGADAILSVTPYYNRPSQAGLLAHFRAIADATELPVVLYDIPGRTGRKIELDTFAALATHPRIVGVKDAAGDCTSPMAIHEACGADFEIYSGDDNLTLGFLAYGAVGAIAVASHWAGREVSAMIDAALDGDLGTAQRLNSRLGPSYRFASSPDAPNPIPAKAMMRHLGQPGGPCRLPMGPEPDGLEEAAEVVIAGLATSSGEPS